METMTEDQIRDSLQKLTGWEFDEDEIKKTFEFADFKESLEFVNEVGKLAEKVNHHPEIEIHLNKVEIELSTHEVSGVTEKDIDLAKQIEEIK